MTLLADALLLDPAFQEAEHALLEISRRYVQRIKGITPPQQELHLSYEQAVAQMNALRGQPLFYPYLGSGIGNGALVELADGSIKYDLISGIGTHFAHSHPLILEATLRAAFEDIAMQGNLQQNRSSLELAKQLTSLAKMDHCQLSSSGAMANENALKLLLQKKAPAQRILAFENGFMGRTLALSSITDRAAFREGLPSLLHVDYVPFYDWRDPVQSSKRALDVLLGHLERYPHEHACMCFELIQGEAGSYGGKRDFFLPLMQLLKERSVPVLVDEIQTFGRTDQLFAFHHFGLQEYVDVVTCGKLLHACATLFRASFAPKPGLISQTFTASSSAIRVATVILKELTTGEYLGREGKNMQLRRQMVHHLQTLADKHPDLIEGPFGYGLMIAFTPFKGEEKAVKAFAQALFEAGVIVFVAGHCPTRIRFLVPPAGLEEQEMTLIAQILEETLHKVVGHVPARP